MYSEKFSNIQKDLSENQLENKELREKAEKIGVLEALVTHLECRTEQLKEHREADAKEIRSLISEMQQWMSRLETSIEYIEKRVK